MWTLKDFYAEEDALSVNYAYNDQVTLKEAPAWLEVDKVRITPGKVVFEDAFVGRNYKRDITIQNLGDHMALVTLIPPSSIAYQVNKIIRHVPLPPGLKLVRTISYTHQSDARTYLGGIIPIDINDQHIEYVLEVSLSTVRIIATPAMLDFGCLDVASSVVVRKLTLENTGTKNTHFAIDLPKENKQLIIEPKKGILKPREKMVLNVELSCNEEGSFIQDVWVKCMRPFTFCVLWHAIKPYLEAIHVNATVNFTLIDFPPTYYGARMFQSMVVRNRSSEKLIYAIVAVIDQQDCNVSTAKEQSVDFRQFFIYPVDGRMDSNEGRILQFMFAPEKEGHEKAEVNENYYFCTLKIVPLGFKDLYTSVFKKQEKKITQEVRGNNFRSSVSLNSLTSTRAPEEHDEVEVAKKYLTIYLHGEAETPQVTTLPTEFMLCDLEFDVEVKRVLLIQNKSSRLPITLKYNKVPFVFIHPSLIRVEAAVGLEVLIRFKVAKLGPINTKLRFDLLYKDKLLSHYQCVGQIELPVKLMVKSVWKKPKPQFNMGITPMITNEVGFLTDDVRFNTKIEKPRSAMVRYKCRKTDDALIAFPNDRPRTHKAWQNDVACRTIFAGIARNKYEGNLDYEMTDVQVEKKMDNDSYFEQYLRKEALKSHKATKKISTDYSLTNKALLLVRDQEYPKNSHLAVHKRISNPEFASLTALQLMRIDIRPNRIQLGQVATNTKILSSIEISSTLEIPIRIFVVPTQNIEYTCGNRHRLKPFECYLLKFLYHGKADGIFDTTIRIVINESHEFDVSVSGEVVPQRLFLDPKVITFDDPNEFSKYITIYNPFAAYTKFSWEMPVSCFDIEPCIGNVPPRSYVVSELSYHPDRNAAKMVDVNFRANYCLNHVVKILGMNIVPNVSLVPDTIFFTDVPLNIWSTRRFGLRNDCMSPVAFEIKNPSPIDGIKMEPEGGTIPRNSVAYITVSVCFEMLISFKYAIHINVNQATDLELHLVGNVVYPDLVIEPSMLAFKRIYEHAYDVLRFKIKNASLAQVDIDLGTQEYKDMRIFRSTNSSVYIHELTLAPTEVAELYIEYIPHYVCSLSIMLPMVINGILGPPDSNCIQTQRNVFFLEQLSVKIPEITPLPIPDSLPVVKIFTSIRKQAITFSMFNMDFNYAPSKTFASVTKLFNVIYNPTVENVDFILRTDCVIPPFSIHYHEGEKVEVNELSIACSLPPKTSTTFRVEFKPNFPQKYKCKIPVYVRNYLLDCVYNYISLNGTYYEPTIVGNVNAIYLEPVFFNITSLFELVLTLTHHEDNCELRFLSKEPELTAVFENGIRWDFSSSINEKYVTLKFVSPKPVSIDTDIQFTCTCEATYTINVKASCENCLCTNHAFLYTNCYSSAADLFKSQRNVEESVLSFQSKYTTSYSNLCNNEHNFPYFPEETDESYYSEYIHSVFKTVESWVYTQGFFKRKYHIIPEDISESTFNENGMVTPYFELFMNIGGSKMKNFIKRSTITGHDSFARVQHLYTLYAQAKYLLISNGAMLPYLQPEYLMTYPDYVEYKKLMNAKPEHIEDYTKFYRLSKHMWLLILLQTYKVCIHDRPVVDANIEYEITPTHCLKMRVIFHWLQDLNKQNAAKLWKSDEQINALTNMEISNITTDFKDSFTLACATFHYCPYLKEYFSCFHLDDSFENKYYNAYKLTLAWKELHMSFDITPKDIIQPNLIQMVMLLNYLFEFLPQLEVMESVTIKSKLSQKKDKNMRLQNMGNYSVKYSMKFFGDNYNCFKVGVNDLVLTPGKSKKIQITYFAKKMAKQSTYLYICGESPTYHYAKSKVIVITGIPDLNSFTQEKVMTLNIYETKNFEFDIQSPYNEPCVYHIYPGITPVVDVSTHKTLDIHKYLYPRRLHFPQPLLRCDENGLGYANFTGIAFTPMTTSYFVYYLNETVGDFCIRVIAKVKLVDKREYLSVSVLENFVMHRCICPKGVVKDECPKTLKIMVPSRNKFQFDAFMETFVSYLGDPTNAFWQRYAKSSVCAHMIEKMKSPTVYVSEDIRHVFDKDILYKVTAVTPDASIDKAIVIKDMKSTDLVPLRYHVNRDAFPTDFVMTLMSKDRRDIRNYYVQFHVQLNKSGVAIKKPKSDSSKNLVNS